MRTRRSRQRKAGSVVGRAFSVAVVVLVFGCCVMLLTCQRQTLEKRAPAPVTSQPGNPTEAQPPVNTPGDQNNNQSHPEAEKPSEDPAETTPESTAEGPESGATQEPLKATEPPPPPPTAPAEQGTPSPSKESRATRALAGDEVVHGDRSSRKIALTFDAGWEFEPTSDILDALAKHGIHATFFLTGRWVAKNPDLTRRIAAEGHEIGNHTYAHRSLIGLSAGEIAQEVEKTDQLVLKLTGHSTKPLVRVPYGARDSRVLSILREQGYRSIYWDVDSWDGFKRGISATEVEKRVVGKTRNGSIVLMHCGSRATADALDSILQKLISAGYEPVTVSELVGL